MTKRTLLFLCSILFLSNGCGNPGLYRYLSPVDPKIPNVAAPVPGSAYSARWEYPVFKKNHSVVKIAEAHPLELPYLIAYSDPALEVAFRVPPFTYIKFIVENQGETPLEIDLFESHFTGAGGRIFRPVTEESFRKLYTSGAYSHYDYKVISAMYISKHAEISPQEKVQEMTKLSPGEKSVIPPGRAAFQIIPFEKFSEGSLIYRLKLPASLGSEPLEFHYKTIRVEGPLEKLPD